MSRQAVDTPAAGVPAGGTVGQALVKLDATDYNTAWGTPSTGGVSLPLGQDLTFAPDSSWNIGAAAASRPATGYFGTALVAGSGSGSVTIGSLATSNPNIQAVSGGLGFAVGGSLRWYVDGSTGHFLAQADNTYDLGGTSHRPRDLVLGRNATIGGTLGVTGAATLSSTLNVTGTTTLGAATISTATIGATSFTGGVQFNPDATYDIGTSPDTSGHRPRHLYLSGDLNANNVYAASNVYVGPAASNKPLLYAESSATSRLAISAPATTGTVDIGSYLQVNLQSNAYTNDGSTWQRWDISRGAMSLAIGSNNLGFYSAPSGANPISAWTALFAINPSGFLQLTTGRARFEGWGSAPASGYGIEIGSDASGGYIYSIDRGTALYRDLTIISRNLSLTTSGGVLSLPSGSTQKLLGSYVSIPSFTTTSVSTWVATPISVASAVTTGGLLRIEWSINWYHSAAGATGLIAIGWSGAQQTGQIALTNFTVTNSVLIASGTYYTTLAAGTYTFTVYVQTGTAGTLGISGSCNCTLYVIEQKNP